MPYASLAPLPGRHPASVQILSKCSPNTERQSQVSLNMSVQPSIEPREPDGIVEQSESPDPHGPIQPDVCDPGGRQSESYSDGSTLTLFNV